MPLSPSPGKQLRTFSTLWQFELFPAGIARGEGETLQTVLGRTHDGITEAWRQSVWLSLPSLCPEGALGRLGRDRGIVRGLAEPEANYRDRLKRWRQDHRLRGGQPALLSQAYAALPATRWYSIDARGTLYSTDNGEDFSIFKGLIWDWDGEPLLPNWARFWLLVVLPEGAEPWPSFADGAWGAAIKDPDVMIGAKGVHPGQIQAIKALTSHDSQPSWTAAGRQPMVLTMIFPGDNFPVAGGDWDSWENRDPDYRYEPLHPSQL